LAAAGLLNIGILEIDHQRVAVRINMEMDNTLYLYYSGFDPRWWRHSVMTFIVTEAMKSAMDSGLQVVNFSPGVDQAKSRWDVRIVPFAHFSVVRQRLRSRTRFATYRLLRRLAKARRSVRQERHRVDGVSVVPSAGPAVDPLVGRPDARCPTVVTSALKLAGMDRLMLA
jgi:CelD/BcsL family acetyltransferase involved in cellulose biosynthesis